MPNSIGLRAADLPFKNIPTTWVMDVTQDALPRPVPAMPSASMRGDTVPTGFWNDLPPEEEEILFSFPSPTDYDRDAIRRRNREDVLNVREMMLLLIGIYLVMMLSHLVLLIVKG